MTLAHPIFRHTPYSLVVLYIFPVPLVMESNLSILFFVGVRRLVEPEVDSVVAGSAWLDMAGIPSMDRGGERSPQPMWLQMGVASTLLEWVRLLLDWIWWWQHNRDLLINNYFFGGEGTHFLQTNPDIGKDPARSKWSKWCRCHSWVLSHGCPASRTLSHVRHRGTVSSGQELVAYRAHQQMHR